jgi:hypothetical protein
MKTPRMLAGFVAVALLAGARCRAQEKPDSQPITPVKVTVVFSELEGEKKISSLPYI